MVEQSTRADGATTPREQLEQFVDSPAYRDLTAEQQAHVREALEHLSQCEQKAVPTIGTAASDRQGVEADEDGVRLAEAGEFTTDIDVN